MRPKSKDVRPTLEILNAKNSEKIRYEEIIMNQKVIKFATTIENHPMSGCKILEFDYIHDEFGVLTISIYNEIDQRMKIIFDSYIVYRKRDEMFAVDSEYNLCDEIKREKLIYRLIDSEFLRWLSLENGRPGEPYKSNHYMIISDNDIIDVISNETPRIICI